MLAVLRRPHLWSTAVRQGFRLARPGWWRRPPFLPVPDADYLAFRMETQYGDDGRPDARDVVTYLEWCREMGALRGEGAERPVSEPNESGAPAQTI
jgi:hypothetical protein